MKLPTGFQAAAVRAGIKPSGKPDLGLIASKIPLYWAMLSTENSLRAPCVSRNRSRLTSDAPVHGVIVNSGAIVEHDCVLVACCHVAPGAVLGGGAVIGPAALVGRALA